MSEAGNDDVNELVMGMVKEAIEQHLSPLMDQLSPLITRLQAQRESGGGEFFVCSFPPFGDDELPLSTPLQVHLPRQNRALFVFRTSSVPGNYLPLPVSLNWAHLRQVGGTK